MNELTERIAATGSCSQERAYVVEQIVAEAMKESGIEGDTYPDDVRKLQSQLISEKATWYIEVLLEELLSLR